MLEKLGPLFEKVANRADDIEEGRCIPSDLVEDIRQAGVFRMLVPERYGGEECDFPETVEILKSFARADGSVGWSLMIGSETPQLLALLPFETFEKIYADGPDVVVGGAFAPKGTAVKADGGIRASGQWGFASGCGHADWLFGNCVIGEPGSPDAQLRCALFPQSEWQILDTWHTSGMRGTGSHDIRIEDKYVSDEYTFDLFGGTPCLNEPLFAAPLIQFSIHIGAVALGIAEGALTELVEFATTGKTRLYGRGPMLESELFQSRVGRSEADLRAAAALLSAEANTYWGGARTGTLTPEVQGQVLQTVAWVAETSCQVVDTLYTAGGGSSIYADSPLQRRLRDIHTLTQHASVQEGVFANSGAALLGNPQAFGL